MGASTVQKRHVSGTPRKKVLQIKVLDGSPATVTPDISPRKRRKRQRSYRDNFWLRPLLSIGLFGMAALLGWKLLGTKVPLSKTKAQDTIPSFQLYADQAPQCHHLSSIDEIDFTLVTQLSQNRLWMMKHHCQRYPHQMSIAVYTNDTLQDTRDELTRLGCDPSLVAVSVLDAQYVGSPEEYPVNLLRNLALAKVKTSHLIYIDVDFWTSENLYEVLKSSPTIPQALIDDPKLALVLPAFMLFRQCVDYRDCRKNNIPLMPANKRSILEMMVKKRGHIFDPTNRGGHGSTLYKDWIRQDPGSLLPINCLQSHRYEPFVIIRWCRDLPPFQEAFNGYGKNKLTWMMQVIRRGYKLSQVGDAFVVHYPHLDSEARTKWNEAPDALKIPLRDKTVQIRRPKKSDGNLNLGSYKRGKVDRLFVDFRNWLEEYVPDTSRMGMCNKAQDDDSKLWLDKEDPDASKTIADAKAAAIEKDNNRIEEEAAAVRSEEDQFDSTDHQTLSGNESVDGEEDEV